MEQKRIHRINGKFYDFGTNNISFRQVAKDLKTVGIKNFYFMLEVKDPSVVYLDPYSPLLTKDAISRIVLECRRNMWYYIREVAQIPEQGGTSVQYLANRGNIAQAWCFANGIDSYLNLPRQRGKTQSALCEIGWGYNYGTTNSQTIFVNKSGEDAKTNLRRIKDQLELLPNYMQFESVYNEEDGKMTKQVKNATRMAHPITKNEIITKAKATSQESALNIARGLTAPIQHFDEVEFTSRIKTIIQNSAPTYEKASENAKKNGALYGRLFTSTPGDLDTLPGQEGLEIVSGCATWTEQMYDLTPEKRNEYIKTNSKNDIVYIEYSYKQLGLTDEWFENISRKIGDIQTVKREVLLQRLRGSNDSLFTRDEIEYILMNVRPVVQELFIKDVFKFDIYEPLMRNIPYIVGVDCSTGTLNDNNAITIINPYTVKPVAEFKCNFIGETAYENLLKDLVVKYIPKAILCIERNSVGDGIIDHLMHSKIRANLYFDVDKDLLTHSINQAMDQESMLKRKAKEKSFIGVWTGQKSRADMMSILLHRMAENKNDFVTKHITDDISRLIKKTSGRIEAMSGFHDDNIMSYLIALYVYYHGNNLEFFGFRKGSQPIENQNEGMYKTIRDVDQDLLPKEVVQIFEKEEQFQKDNDYAEILRKAIAVSQQESARMSQSNIMQSDIRVDDYSTDVYDEDNPDNGYQMDLSLFDDLN